MIANIWHVLMMDVNLDALIEVRELLDALLLDSNAFREALHVLSRILAPEMHFLRLLPASRRN